MIDNTKALTILYMRIIKKEKATVISQMLNVGRNTVANVCKRNKLMNEEIEKLYKQLQNGEVTAFDLNSYFSYKRKGSLTDDEIEAVKEMCREYLYCYYTLEEYMNDIAQLNQFSYILLFKYGHYIQDRNAEKNLSDNDIKKIQKVWYKKNIPKNFQQVYKRCLDKGIDFSYSSFRNIASELWDNNAIDSEIKKAIELDIPLCQYFVNNYESYSILGVKRRQDNSIG